ncbi:hypothetical protein LTR78_004314 [Recurvomyces mirabilis]|uniref:NmrA-like domain-containing protein n=1 Tax=Recurvomyces mirabilis TaxID=574656 RepID=A0AAE0WPU2_9PEZI|nr:hypothetical protein LTR78_004314 [Recurvomyces mirabilis]KAK5156019.1 hypothetical protein LTS14_005585 [Recurvomyces mirabilis]
MTAPSKKIFIIGGTGAQELVKDNAYSVRILTWNPSSKRAQDLATLPNVELQEGKLDSDEELRRGFQGCWGAFVNLDGFVIGQKNEIFWGIRSYQLAQEAEIKFFVWGNLDYVLREANYDPQHHCGHYDAKGAVGEFILAQNNWHAERARKAPTREMSSMGAALFTTGPYLDMALSKFTPMTPKIAEDGVVEWQIPLNSGAVVHIALEDCGKYVRWLFDHALALDGQPGRSHGMNLAVANEHVKYEDLAAAFAKVTGHPARFINVSEEDYWSAMPSEMLSQRIGKQYSDMQDTDGSLMTFQENFRSFWRMWQACGGEEPLIKRDYRLLDEILPDRIKTVGEWMERNREMAVAVVEVKAGMILKIHEDRA